MDERSEPKSVVTAVWAAGLLPTDTSNISHDDPTAGAVGVGSVISEYNLPPLKVTEMVAQPAWPVRPGESMMKEPVVPALAAAWADVTPSPANMLA
jgi:hypothetical protein